MLTGTSIIAVLITILLSCFIPTAHANFHSGGVGSCQGCHIGGHGTEGGVPDLAGSSSPLLRASDPSSICLNCHSGAGSSQVPSVFSFDGSALTPGGDFYWMTRTFSWIGGSSPAARHGHDIVAQDFGLVADPNRIRGPGGNYPAAQLSCISCHDPHGRTGGGTQAGAAPVSVSGSYGELPAPGTSAGHYRLLGGQSYTSNGYSFNNPVPLARQNPALPFSESSISHGDYGSGISAWCGNCHAAVISNKHELGASSFEHPVEGTLESGIVNHYNSYIKTGDLTGIKPTAYLQFVPFERGVSDPQLLDPTSSSGPDTASELNCLTCHRAHASAFRSAGRWDFSAVKLVDSHPALGDSGATASDVLNSYYGHNIAVEFGIDQGQFCEKCHVDENP